MTRVLRSALWTAQLMINDKSGVNLPTNTSSHSLTDLESQRACAEF